MGKASVRPCLGENPVVIEIAVPCDADKPFVKLLKKAAKVVDELDPIGVTLSGFSLDYEYDQFILELIVSDPANSLPKKYLP